MDSIEDSIKKFLNKYIFTQKGKSKIGQYGNDVVDLINKFIRIIIAFMIVYLIITKLPDHGDKDHTMYFNLLLLISIFLLLIYIQKNWREYYLNNFLKSGDVGPECAQDQDEPPDYDINGNKCLVTLGENGDTVIDCILLGLVERLDPTENWDNYLYLIGLGILLRQLNYKWWYALLIFIPINSIKGIIYYILYASKYSPINFLFGKTGNIEDPYLYGDNEIKGPEDEDKRMTERQLVNFNERFYVMYIVLILLIFFIIIIRLTSDTIIDCKNFVGPIPIDALQGCIGYRFYMILNVLLFIGFSVDFMNSLNRLSSDETPLICSTKFDDSGKHLPRRMQIYTSSEGECRKPEDFIKGTPQYCNAEEEILECLPKNPSSLSNCFIKRSDYNSGKYILNDITTFREKKRLEKNDSFEHRIIIKKNSDGIYEIDESNEIEIQDQSCKNSIENWLRSKSDDNLFEIITNEE